ncbi:ABC-2 type transport system ATP-binding protein [Chitinophaga skermanii]|uniref:ABC-2 type transport system ATP-binding protein n=1 Tax=Chitinophaga skermanii TaxID=331697 RepID=A0A327R3A9_9BACT|nr:ABC transporter ATP-binding protein [Chitinophaga skermanii]RAJ08367.1 ABC-2 type transport system ATP-binding protein [Chitinophaga skermanii]
MITVDNLTYSYNKKTKLFNGLHLHLQAGKIYGLLGKNGAGKSTLMKIITGLLSPSEGTCLVNGLPPQQREKKFLEQLFFIPEECYLPPLTIEKFIAIYSPFYPRFSHATFTRYLEEFHINGDKELQQLSFGQKKKTVIAFALAANTQLLVMDEPTNGLDIPSKIQFRKIMAQANKADRIILLSTHQVRDVNDLVNSIIIMDNSSILLHEDKQHINDLLKFCYKQALVGQEDVLYEENTSNGTIVVCRNHGNVSTSLDVEILFNATLSNPTLISSIFNQ